MGDLPALLAQPVERPVARIGATQSVAPAGEVVVFGAIGHRDRSQQAHPEAGVAQQPPTLQGHLDDHVGASLLGARVGVADSAQVATNPVAEPLQGGGDDRGVLEAVAAPATADELLLDVVEGDAGVPVEQHVDVVEGERAHVRLVQLGECPPAGFPRGDAQSRQVAIEIEPVDLPGVLGHVPSQAHPW
jgi:hypothetical protein